MDKEDRILDLTEQYIEMRDQRDELLKEVAQLKEEKSTISDANKTVHRQLEEMRQRKDTLTDDLCRVLKIVNSVLKLPNMQIRSTDEMLIQELDNEYESLWSKYFDFG